MGLVEQQRFSTNLCKDRLMCLHFIQFSDLQSIILKDFLSYWTPSKHFPSLATEICTLVFQET